MTALFVVLFYFGCANKMQSPRKPNVFYIDVIDLEPEFSKVIDDNFWSLAQ